MAKADIKTCRYAKCPSPNHAIDLSKDSYVVVGSAYYHCQCKQDEDAMKARRSEQIKEDRMRFLDLWNDHISNKVNFAYLQRILNAYLDRGVSMHYLLFCLQYVIDHNMNLSYPNGFKYYIDREEIKQAYKKACAKKVDMGAFRVTDGHDEPPKARYAAPKGFKGFAAILGEKP